MALTSENVLLAAELSTIKKKLATSTGVLTSLESRLNTLEANLTAVLAAKSSESGSGSESDGLEIGESENDIREKVAAKANRKRIEDSLDAYKDVNFKVRRVSDRR